MHRPTNALQRASGSARRAVPAAAAAERVAAAVATTAMPAAAQPDVLIGLDHLELWLG